MSKNKAFSLIRRWGPATVILAAIVVVGVLFHRPILAWFGGNPDAIFGSSGSTTFHDVGDLHTAGALNVGAHIDPHRPVVGNNRLLVAVETPDGEPVTDASVEAVAIMPAMGAMPEMRASALFKHVEGGRYAGDLELTMAGGWPLTLKVDSPTHGKATLHFDLATTIEGLRLTDASGTGRANSAAATQPINDVCPVLGNKVPDGAVTLTWKGHTIGFCCPGCDTEFDGWSDEKKQAFVDEVLNDLDEGASESQPDTQPTTQPGVEDKRGSTTKPTAPTFDGASDEIAYWTCSMHPSVKSQDPGGCPICKMDLTSVTNEEVQSGVVFVDAQRRQLIGVRTTTVREQNLNKTIRAVGIVAYDETRLTDVTLKYRGWIGQMFADYTGKHVTQGEPLLTIYSPELLSAQQEYLDAAAAADVPGRTSRVAQSAKERLLLWDLTESQLAELVERGKPLQYIPVLSPATGTIIKKMAVKGSAVEPGRMIYRIADLSTVWIEAELYEDEVPLVKVGQKVNVSVSYLPGKKFEGTVAYIYPYLDPKTRRGRIRIEVANEAGLLKPDMYADVYIKLPLGKRLAVPEEAVLYGGENNVVFLDLGEGRMRPQRVTLGVRATDPGLGMDLIEVLDGLKPGDTVVTSGNFLIASESKLKSGIEKW